MSDMIDCDESDFLSKKYLRVGWIDRETNSDSLAKSAFGHFKGTVLPMYWQYRSLAHFQKKFGTDKFHWAQAASYHLLLLNGHHVFRLWTDCPQTAIVDVSDSVAANLPRPGLGETVTDVPEKAFGKTKPLKKRVTLSNKEELQILLTTVEKTYGI